MTAAAALRFVVLALSGSGCLVGCTPHGDHAPAPDAASTPAVASASDASPLPAHSLDGAHDYRGTLGSKTGIAMHLVGSGTSVRGSYVYLAIGRPIPLDGTADTAGAVALTETADGKSTGTFRLRPRGDDLTGEWTDPAGKKTFAVELAPGAPFEVATGDAGKPTSASRRAEECLAQPSCPAAEAAALFATASDTREPDLDCFRFIDGAGTPRDLARGRACLERRADALACGGSSMFLGGATLALMRIDGIGGAPDVAGAGALVDGCFDDVTREAVVAHAAARSKDPKTPPVDFCKNLGGTTITLNECEARSSKNADTARELQAKMVVAGLDDEGKALFATSDKAYGDYVEAMSDYVYEVYIDGTIRGAMSLSTQVALKAARAKDLEALPRFVAKDTTPNDVAAAERDAALALARVGTTTPAEKAALGKTQRTWEAYRDAEVALYAHAFGPKQGADRVAATLRVRLASRRAKECAPPSAGGDGE